MKHQWKLRRGNGRHILRNYQLIINLYNNFQLSGSAVLWIKMLKFATLIQLYFIFTEKWRALNLSPIKKLDSDNWISNLFASKLNIVVLLKPYRAYESHGDLGSEILNFKNASRWCQCYLKCDPRISLGLAVTSHHSIASLTETPIKIIS